MADETKTVLIDVEVEDNSFDEKIGKVNTELKKNREEIKELNKDYANNAKEIAKLENKNRDLSATKRELIKDSKAEAGSLNDLRRQLANQVKERNNLNRSTEEGAKKFDEMNKSILALNEEISGFEEAGGDFRRNVGDYPRLLGEAAGGTKIFGTSLNDVFNIIKANPIILLISTLAGLVKVFSETQKGAEFFQKTTAALNAALGVMKDIVEATGVALIGAFSNPKETLDNLVTTIKEGVLKYFTEFIPNAINQVIDGFGLLASAAKQLFEGDFEAALETATEGTKKLVDGVTDIIPATAILKTAVETAVPALTSFGDSIVETTGKAFDLEQQLIANEKALADSRVSLAQSIESQKQLNLIVEDTTLGFEERIAAAQEFAEVEAEQIANSIALQEERIRILKEQNELTNSTEEDIQRVRDAEIELANLRAASLEREVTNNNKLNTVLAQQVVAKQKAVLDEKKILDKKAKEDAKRDKDLATLKKNIAQQAQADLATLFAGSEELSKAFALTEIGFDTAKAIAGLTAASESNPANAFTFGGAGIAQFAAGLLRIGANIASATRLLSGGTSLPSSSGGGTGSTPTGLSFGGVQSAVNGSLIGQFSNDGIAAATSASATGQAVGESIGSPVVSVVEIIDSIDSLNTKVGEATLGGG